MTTSPLPTTLPVLETERLLLRPLRAEDAPAIFAYASNPNVSRFTLWEPHQTLADTERYLREYVAPKYEAGQPEPFGLTLKSAPDVVIGTVGCFVASPPFHTMELAYALAEPHWGQGLVVEAARAVRDFVFARYPVERFQCRCKSENRQSERVMQKLGLTREGVLRASLYHRERYVDMTYYAQLRAEWEAQRA